MSPGLERQRKITLLFYCFVIKATTATAHHRIESVFIRYWVEGAINIPEQRQIFKFDWETLAIAVIIFIRDDWFLRTRRCGAKEVSRCSLVVVAGEIEFRSYRKWTAYGVDRGREMGMGDGDDATYLSACVVETKNEQWHGATRRIFYEVDQGAQSTRGFAGGPFGISRWNGIPIWSTLRRIAKCPNKSRDAVKWWSQ